MVFQSNSFVVTGTVVAWVVKNCFGLIWMESKQLRNFPRSQDVRCFAKIFISTKSPSLVLNCFKCQMLRISSPRCSGCCFLGSQSRSPIVQLEGFSSIYCRRWRQNVKWTVESQNCISDTCISRMLRKMFSTVFVTVLRKFIESIRELSNSAQSLRKFSFFLVIN